MGLFGTAGIRGDTTTTVTPDLALRVGRAVGTLAREHEPTAPKPVVTVGRDGRQTSPALQAAVTAGLASTGVRIATTETCPTPALAHATTDPPGHGVMITASHNPPPDNGIKLFHHGREYDPDRETRIETLLDDPPAPAAWNDWTTPTQAHILPAYRQALSAYADQWGDPPTDLTIAVDCANGPGARATPSVLRAHGARVATLNANIDGTFPGRPSEPTPDTLDTLRRYVTTSQADLGIGHDGDADRTVGIDADGAIVPDDTVTAILADHYTTHAATSDPVVITTPNTSTRVDDRVQAAGGRTVRVPLGQLHDGIRGVQHEDAPDTRVVFAAEPGKHIHPGFGPWIDGIATALVLARLVARAGSLNTLRAPVRERPTRTANVPCPDPAKPVVMDHLTDALPDALDPARVDPSYGLRLEFDDGGWLLVRPSGTEPKVRLYAESENLDELLPTAVRVVETLVTDAA